jgi:2-O-methyltransferase
MIRFKPHEAYAYIKPYLPENSIVIEAGAFDGHDTQRMAHAFPTATIHAFEPVPQIFEQLATNTASLANVHCYQVALSNQTGMAELYLSEKLNKPHRPSQANSLRKPKERLQYSTMQFPHSIMVPTITLDDWAQQQQVDHLDFLWLDLQGHELAVLSASPIMLATLCVIYTEVAFIEAYEGQPKFPEVTSWMAAQGFTLVGCNFHEPPRSFFGNVLYVRQP